MTGGHIRLLDGEDGKRGRKGKLKKERNSLMGGGAEYLYGRGEWNQAAKELGRARKLWVGGRDNLRVRKIAGGLGDQWP